MRDFFTLDQTPCDEPCASVGEPDYEEKALAQCRRFIGLLRQTFGLEPDGTRLSIKSFPHDFGTYYSVVTGWVIKYLVVSITTGFPDLGAATDPESIRVSHQAAISRFNDLAERRLGADGVEGVGQLAAGSPFTEAIATCSGATSGFRFFAMWRVSLLVKGRKPQFSAQASLKISAMMSRSAS